MGTVRDRIKANRTKTCIFWIHLYARRRYVKSIAPTTTISKFFQSGTFDAQKGVVSLSFPLPTPLRIFGNNNALSEMPSPIARAVNATNQIKIVAIAKPIERKFDEWQNTHTHTQIPSTLSDYSILIPNPVDVFPYFFSFIRIMLRALALHSMRGNDQNCKPTPIENNRSFVPVDPLQSSSRIHTYT